MADYSGYLEALKLVRELHFDPNRHVSTELYQMESDKLAHINTCFISTNTHKERFLVLKSDFYVDIKGVQYIVKLILMLKEDYPKSYPYIQLDTFQDCLIVNPAASYILPNKCIFNNLLKNWTTSISLCEALASVRDNFLAAYPLVQKSLPPPSIYANLTPPVNANSIPCGIPISNVSEHVSEPGSQQSLSSNTSPSQPTPVVPTPQPVQPVQPAGNYYKTVSPPSMQYPPTSSMRQNEDPSLIQLINKECELDESNAIPYIPIQDLQFGNMIGQGSYATVYDGKYQIYRVALKEIRGSSSSKQKQSLLREITIMYKCAHPYVIKLFGISERRKNTIIVLEKAEYCLTDLLQAKRETLPMNYRLGWSLQIAIAIASLHNFGFIHRDIKTENILLVKGTCKLADFGLARQEDSDIRMTYCGTPAGMPPELILNQKYDNKVDVYSYAMVLYEIFTRQLPYDDIVGDEPWDRFKIRISRENLRPTITDAIPAEIKTLMIECWDTNPAKRPSMNEIVTRLQGMTNVVNSWKLKN